jgi:predicted regulator of Ras-like GTPase activity (Roadblock/LC7/MglB family)
MQAPSPRLAPTLLAIAQRHLQELVDANPPITLAVLTSGDGFEIAAYPGNLPVAQRIAAMTSSLQALSEAIVREAGLGRSRNVIIESDGGTIVVLGLANTSPRLSLAIMAAGDEILGRLLWASRSCCGSLESNLKT